VEQARLELELNALDGRPILSAIGELDAWTADAFREAVHGVLAGKPDCVIVDLTRVSFMDSGALQVLVSACQKMAASGRLYAVATGVAERLIRTTGLDRLINLRRTLDEVRAEAND
jgi:anti-anti-sigma factor